MSRMGYTSDSFMFPNRKTGRDRDRPMLLSWLKKDDERRDLDEQSHDEASMALIPKSVNDELSKTVRARDDEDEESIIGETEYKKPPWWSWIWVRSSSSFLTEFA
jgi:hypothetical protein